MVLTSITQKETKIIPFEQKIGNPLTKSKIKVLQINLGKRCNLACTHCHVEAGPNRTEELSPEVCQQLIKVIQRFPQIETVDLTGGAPEMNYGFREITEAAKSAGKEVIVRSNLTIYFVSGYEDLPEYCANQQVRIVASLPCYLENNVDQQRGFGVYKESVKAIQQLNKYGYGSEPNLKLDLVYNPPLPKNTNFSLPPQQKALEEDYRQFLEENFNIQFNELLTITNLPIGRTKQYLQRRNLHSSYLHFLEKSYNENTVSSVMCRNELSVDYLGNIFDCDFNQMENIPAKLPNGEKLTVTKLLQIGDIHVINKIQTRPYCYGCTAGSGSSCGGSLV